MDSFKVDKDPRFDNFKMQFIFKDVQETKSYGWKLVKKSIKFSQ